MFPNSTLATITALRIIPVIHTTLSARTNGWCPFHMYFLLVLDEGVVMSKSWRVRKVLETIPTLKLGSLPSRIFTKLRTNASDSSVIYGTCLSSGAADDTQCMSQYNNCLDSFTPSTSVDCVSSFTTCLDNGGEANTCASYSAQCKDKCSVNYR